MIKKPSSQPKLPKSIVKQQNVEQIKKSIELSKVGKYYVF